MDFPDLAETLKFLRKLRRRPNLVKVGSQLFTAEGPEAIRRIAKLALGIFLDLKFCDIPNTVAGAVRAAAELPGVRMMSVHATGGLPMLQAAKNALAGLRKPPTLLGVTVLTSLDGPEMARIGLEGPLRRRVLALADIAKQAGIGGLVAPAQELRSLRQTLGKEMIIVVPGIRHSAATPSSARTDDQAQIATPGNAIRWGADYLVVGRPITAAPDPCAAMDSILQEMKLAMKQSK